MDTLSPFRRYFRYAALACSVFSAVLTFYFGLNQNPHWVLAIAVAGFLVACSLASDYIALFVVDAWRQRNWGMLGTFTVGMFVVFSLNLMSNLGSVGWQRDSVAAAAKVQNTRYDDVRDQVTEGKASLEMWKARLAKLEAENAWAATVTADGLRAQLDAAQKAIDLEAARGGCKSKCLALMEKKAELESRISIAEETGGLRKKIEATKAVLAKHREKAENTDVIVAAPVSQVSYFASMATVSLEPTDFAKQWTDRGMASWLAIGLCFAPILFGLIGWKTEGKSDDDTPPSAKAPVTQATTLARVAPVGIPSEPVHIHTTETIKDPIIRRWALTDEVQSLLNGGQLKAA